jgi:hypothetical protein
LEGEIVSASYDCQSKMMAHVFFGRDFQDYEFRDTFCATRISWADAPEAEEWAIKALRLMHPEVEYANFKNA